MKNWHILTISLIALVSLIVIKETDFRGGVAYVEESSFPDLGECEWKEYSRDGFIELTQGIEEKYRSWANDIIKDTRGKEVQIYVCIYSDGIAQYSWNEVESEVESDESHSGVYFD